MAASIGNMRVKRKLMEESATPKLLKSLSTGQYSTRLKALNSLMDVLQSDGFTTVSSPNHPFNLLLAALIEAETDNTKLIVQFHRYLEYDDIRYYTMQYLMNCLKHSGGHNVKLENVFLLICNLNLPVNSAQEVLANKFAQASAKKAAGTGEKEMIYQEQRKLFTRLWFEFLNQPLTNGLYKSILVVLDHKVMPNMVNPLQLSDFFIKSYSMGGVISLLALNGLFVLINKYNLNYPHFYEKLYALLHPEVLVVKYRARFLFLLDLFLTSTHLPAYLVAAFAKKLSRLALSAPPEALKSLMPLIYNLIIRHPNCKSLLHSPTSLSLSSDPFIDSEADPTRCRALDSSLWELKSLTQHYHHSVAVDALKCEEQLPVHEMDISEVLEVSVDELIEGDTRKKIKKVPTTFDAPTGLISKTDSYMAKLWKLV